ncbi:hypothetical protein CONPUDRAFT_163072 [Coniophora puteana RWD-64-598 SS2]|uniref:F-box domain-containing protein n=1 Tax=Coniophora puteana (strain RWD-64-598) TaxID=741705 RepID=A0A5M3MXE9_CONPW|nr:uncharacterized protein CONPUDRAFT_163072 [Coniophora puteana RWD-64-598 SS2]EIW83768.1 hypothetical protein CONPUDRAFT_163072 [Coniophora puteana RWD-64-598 SS2]
MTPIYAQSATIGDLLDLIPRVIDDVDRTLDASPCAPHVGTNNNISQIPLANDARRSITEYTSLREHLRSAAARISQCAIKVNESIKAHMRLFSAVNRLPPEILASIFIQALPPMKDVWEDMCTAPPFRVYVPEGRGIVLNFAQVCRSWREVALACPRLWNPVLYQHGFTTWVGLSMGEGLEELVRRANRNGAPVDLLLDMSERPIGLNPDSRDTLRGVCQDELALFQGQCTAIEINIRCGSALPPLLEHLSHPSGLSRLRIMGDIMPTDPGAPALLDPARHPALTDLTLQALNQPLDISRVFAASARWDKLMSLQLITYRFINNEAPHQVVRKILDACPSLRQLLIRCAADKVTAALQDDAIAPDPTSQQNALNVDPSEILTSTSLRTLVLAIYSTHTSSMLLSLLRCPWLHTLVVKTSVTLSSLETFLTHAVSVMESSNAMHHLPIEVIEAIMPFALPPMPDLFSNTDLNFAFSTYISGGRSTALNLARVCSAWREICLRNPELWRVIFLKINRGQDLRLPPPQHVQELIRRASLKAADAPLRLVLDASASGLGLRDNIEGAFEGVLAPFKGRCTEVEIDILEGGAIPRLLTFLTHSNHGLSRLRVMGDFPFPWHHDRRTMFISPSQQTSLEHLSLQAPGMSNDMLFDVRHFWWAESDVQWTALRSLQLNVDRLALPPARSVFHILSACPCLEELRLRQGHWDSMPPLDDSLIDQDWWTEERQDGQGEVESRVAPFACASLRTLVLDIRAVLPGSALLRVLRCPSLQTLVVNMYVLLPSVEVFLRNAGEVERLVIATKGGSQDKAVGRLRDGFPGMKVEAVDERDGRAWFALPVWYKDGDDAAWDGRKVPSMP